MSPLTLPHKLNNLYPLKVIKNPKDYKAALASMEAVFDETEGDLADYAETLVLLIEKYEDEHYPLSQSTSVEVLQFLMEQHKLKQKNLVRILGSKPTVSEIFNGKRPLNLNHIRKLAERFGVSPATFI